MPFSSVVDVPDLDPIVLQALKDSFLDRTNRPRTRCRAIQAAIAPASQHNVLYANGLNARAKREVRTYWTGQLDQISSEYTRHVSATDYLNDVEKLKEAMNDRFAHRFYAVPDHRYEPGFRVSHAQKSLSICLKHLW